MRCAQRHREERAQQQAHACGRGLEGDERRSSDVPRPPGPLTLEDMAALWCPGQVPAVRCRCWPALPSYAAPRTSFHGLWEGLLFAGSVAISVAQTNDVHTGGSNDRFFLWWLLNSFSTVVAQKTPHRIGGSNK